MKHLILCCFLVGACYAQSDEQLIKAFSRVESSDNWRAIGDRVGTKYYAYGLFQFHFARYVELGGKNWGSAGEEEQIRVFKKEIELVRKKSKIDFVRALATYHNLGHISNIETTYVKKIRRELDKRD